MPDKCNATITIDKNVWALAKDKLPTSRSAFIEHQIKLFLNIEDPEQKVLDKICSKKQELHALEDKLYSIQEAKKLKKENGIDFSNCMIPVNRLVSNQGNIGRNQLRNIAHQNDVSSEDLEQHCIENDIEIVNFAEVPK